jgi:hypothetical protein
VSFVVAAAASSTVLPAAASLHAKPLSTEAACKRIDTIMTAGARGDPLGFVDRLLAVSAKTKDKTIRREVARIFASSMVILNGGPNDGGIKKGSANLGDYCGPYT